MPLGAARERRTAERHALVDRAVVADLRGFADHHTHAVVDKHAPPERCTRMDFDTRHEARHLRNETCQPTAPRLPARMREPMQHERVQTGITRDDFPCAAGGGVALADRGDIFAKSREHGRVCVVGEKTARMVRHA
jgi:hypothetical protein